MDLKELDSFRLSDAVKFHDKLNPLLWQDHKLDTEVRDQLLVIAKDFVSTLGISDIDIKDITVSGSNAAYSYTPHSDLDLHIVVDIPKLNDEVYRELFNAKKTLYNDSHDITVHGIPVELYVQDYNEPVESLGEYSIVDDKWIRIPKKKRPNFNEVSTKNKFENLSELVDLALHTKDLDRVEKTIDTIRRYRKAALHKGGEFSPENLAFKAIRKQGKMDALYNLKNSLRSKKLSIEEALDREDVIAKIKKLQNTSGRTDAEIKNINNIITKLIKQYNIKPQELSDQQVAIDPLQDKIRYAANQRQQAGDMLRQEWERFKKNIFSRNDMEEDYDPNGPPPGPEFNPTMPKGTVRVDVSDVYDWYKLGQHISNMKGLGKHDFGKGPPSTVLSFGDEDLEHQYIKDLEKTGLTTTDIDPFDPNQPKGMKRQKTDPTYNVNETDIIDEYRSQEIIHTNPNISTLKSLARNNKYGSARFTIDKDGRLKAGDSALYTHQDIEPAYMAVVIRGYVNFHDGKYHYRTMGPYDNLPKDHPILDRFEKYGIENGNVDMDRLTENVEESQIINLLSKKAANNIIKTLRNTTASKVIGFLLPDFKRDKLEIYGISAEQLGIPYTKDPILAPVLNTLEFRVVNRAHNTANATYTPSTNTIDIYYPTLQQSTKNLKYDLSTYLAKVISHELQHAVEHYKTQGITTTGKGFYWTQPAELNARFQEALMNISVAINNAKVNKSNSNRYDISKIIDNVLAHNMIPSYLPKTGKRYKRFVARAYKFFVAELENPKVEKPINIVKRAINYIMDKPTTEIHESFNRHLDEIGFADALGTLKLPDTEIITNSKVTGTIGQKPVRVFKKGTNTLYFFSTDTNILALVLLDGDYLKAIKNFTDEKGMVYSLLNYITSIEGTRINIAPSEPFTAEGIEWLFRLASNTHGLRLTTTSGDEVDTNMLRQEWNISRLTKEPGETGLVISEMSAAWKKRLIENENSLMPFRTFEYTDKLTEASGYIPSAKEKNDPRFKTALTVDVKPDSIKKNAKAFNWKTSRAGIPPQARADGKIAEDLMKEWKSFLAEDQQQINISVTKGKNNFATKMTVDGKEAGIYQYDGDTGRSIAEVYPEFKGKGLGKVLVLHAIYTANISGIDFIEDESRTQEYDNVLDSLSSNSYIVDDDGYWYVTGDGENYLKKMLNGGLTEDQQELFPGYDEQHREKRLSNWLAKSWGVQNGKPQIFYHATTKDFDTFNTHGTGFASALGMAFEVERHGSFFAVDPKFAEDFIEDPNTGQVKEGGRVLPVYLSIQNPIDLRDNNLSYMLRDEDTVEGFKQNDIDLNSIYNYFSEYDRWELFDGPEGAEFVDNLQKLGFDGAIINERPEEAESGEVWVAFNPNQVKAIHNRGSFSPDDPRMMKENG